MQIKRTALLHLKYLSSHFPVAVVTGARQTGKTTLIKEFAAGVDGIQYVTLEYPALRNLARTGRYNAAFRLEPVGDSFC